VLVVPLSCSTTWADRLTWPTGKSSRSKRRPRSCRTRRSSPQRGRRSWNRIRQRTQARTRRYADPDAPCPDDLTDYPGSYVTEQNRRLDGLFVSLVFYIGAVLFFALIMTRCGWSLSHPFIPNVLLTGDLLAGEARFDRTPSVFGPSLFTSC
jgi:hypothetical protein